MCGKRERVLGRVGAYLGHLRAVKYAVEHKLKKPVLILDIFHIYNKFNIKKI